MAPRSSWKGFIKLSLVSVPVKAFTAHNTGEEIRLNQLHSECNSRVRYLKVCPEHGELKSDQIVSGYQYAKDQYVVIDPEELSRIRPQADHSISIEGFIGADEVEATYLSGRNYYLMPDGVAGKRSYALLQRGMVKAGVSAIAQVVMSGREQLVVLRALENMIVMSGLTHAKNVRGVDQFSGEIEDQETTKEELALAETLIHASTIKDFDLASCKDDYMENLSRLIEMKIEGREVVQAPDLEAPKIINLMDALKKSVAEAQTRSAHKMAPSVKGKKKADAARKTERKKKTG